MTAADTALKLAKSGASTLACGHSRRARVIGIAERTPHSLAG
jgi:hypothetical protein